ncbi:hypothetical protein JR316_0010230 [Psilocybe cubensis]|uniref:Uncharacterized protein n=2 Tax=Psilocybe cubensis TaxID=181762 RepID=A0ACB8GRE9_PSICU|nr:hypothetical protein JR316_0010230 [Psilocybe cubensis]KAH9477997.1 hypothetical protein JR316_0010230 [Psilocybe cubensis]
MPPTPWATPDQIEFMSTWLPQFQDAQRNKNIADFWVKLYAKFFLRWKGPEDEVQPDLVQLKKRKKDNRKLPQTSTPIELDHAAWIKLRKTQIANWFNNRGKGSENRRQGPAIVIGSAGPSQRALSELNVYSKRYYNEKICSLVEKELEKQGGPAHIALINKCISEAWAMESEDVKEEIRAETKRLKELLKEDRSGNSEQPTPQEYAKAIMEAPGQITNFLQEMYKRTGWCLSLLAGGPDPSRQGKIRTISIHMGKDKFDQFYSCAYPDFQENVLAQKDRDNRALSETEPIASMKTDKGGIMDDCEDNSGPTVQIEVEKPTLVGNEDGPNLMDPDGRNDIPAAATEDTPAVATEDTPAAATEDTPAAATEATVTSTIRTTEPCNGVTQTPATPAIEILGHGLAIDGNNTNAQQCSDSGPDDSRPVSLVDPPNGKAMDGDKLYAEEDKVLSFMELLNVDGGYDPERDPLLQISMNNVFFSNHQFVGSTQENRAFQVPITATPMAWVPRPKDNTSFNVQAPVNLFPPIPTSTNNPNGHSLPFYHQEGLITPVYAPTAGSYLSAQPAVMTEQPIAPGLFPTLQSAFTPPCAPYFVQPEMMPTISNQNWAHSNTLSAVTPPVPEQLGSSTLMDHCEPQNLPSLRFSDALSTGMPNTGYTNPDIFPQFVQATPSLYGSGHHNVTIPQIVQAHVGVSASGVAQESRTSSPTSQLDLRASMHSPQSRPSASEKQERIPVTGGHPTPRDTVSDNTNCTTATGTMIVPTPALESVAHASQTPVLNEMNAEMQHVVGDGGRRARKAASSRNVPMQQMWRTAAFEHLMMPEIDTEKWKSCVKAWVAFEDSQCNAIETSSLRFPAAMRPAVLTKWLSTRKYGNVPDIGAKFGDEWVMWWNNSQPKWRQSSEAGKLPRCLSIAGGKDSINMLKKGGPNGLVTVMIGLRWWAKQRHSDPRWEEAVEDILAVFQAFQGGGKVTKKRKGDEENIEAKPKVKRRKT